MAHTDIPNAAAKIRARDTDVPWYNESIGDQLGPTARQLLENYSHIPSSEVESYVYAIRDKAWQIWPYPCIGQFRFLDLSITSSPHYSTLLERLKQDPACKFLDIGCCFGQDLRSLAANGVPSERLYGSDLRSEFFSLGYELFKDKQTLKSRFLVGDVLDSTSDLKQLDGQISIIYAASFLHLFDYEQQVQVCERFVKLLRPEAGSVILGRQVGHVEAGPRPHRTNPGEKMFRHNVESFEKMWKEIGAKTGTEWRVEAELSKEWQGPGKQQVQDWKGDVNVRRLRFGVFRM